MVSHAYVIVICDVLAKIFNLVTLFNLFGKAKVQGEKCLHDRKLQCRQPVDLALQRVSLSNLPFHTMKNMFFCCISCPTVCNNPTVSNKSYAALQVLQVHTSISSPSEDRSDIIPYLAELLTTGDQKIYNIYNIIWLLKTVFDGEDLIISAKKIRIS